MPRSLGEAPRRPLVVLLPGKDEWQEPPDPELTELGPPQRSVERQREPEMYWGCLVHRVRAGENLSRIAEQYYGQEKYAAGLQQFNPQAFNENQALLADKLIYLPTEPLRRRDGSRKAPAVRPDFYITRAGDSWSTIARDLLGSAGEAEQLRKLNFHLSAGVKPLPSGIKIKLK